MLVKLAMLSSMAGEDSLTEGCWAGWCSGRAGEGVSDGERLKGGSGCGEVDDDGGGRKAECGMRRQQEGLRGATTAAVVAAGA